LVIVVSREASFLRPAWGKGLWIRRLGAFGTIESAGIGASSAWRFAMLETMAPQPVDGHEAASGIEMSEVKARVGAILNRRPAVGFAVGVVRDGRLDLFEAHGIADIASKTPITEDTGFRIASITKTFTAIAVMQLQEQGLVDLDAPANDYLRAYRLTPADAGFRPATVRHLLTHTSGVPEVLHPWDVLRPDFGESVEIGGPLPSLGELCRSGLPVNAEPGTRFIYSDYGFATLGQIVEDVSGQPFDIYLREHIFDPLGMEGTDLNRSRKVTARLATGYKLGSRGAKAIVDRQWVTPGASSIYSTPRDMARYLSALLGGGSNEHGSVLERETMATMFEPNYQPDVRLPGIGLSFFRFDIGGHLAVEHGGILPGFNSQIFAAPDEGVAVMAFTNGAKGAMFWLPGEVVGLLNYLLGVPEKAIRREIPHHPEIWADICGRYQLSARLTDARARMMLGAGAEVFVRGGRLMLRGLTPIPALLRGLPLHPDDEKDPYVFRLDLSRFGIGTVRVVFSRGPEAGAASLHLDVMPLGLHKHPASA
jgi:CubicO group peptidase (beta-lactamase class C family)